MGERRKEKGDGRKEMGDGRKEKEGMVGLNLASLDTFTRSPNITGNCVAGPVLRTSMGALRVILRFRIHYTFVLSRGTYRLFFPGEKGCMGPTPPLRFASLKYPPPSTKKKKAS